MEIKFIVTKEERKALVKAIAEITAASEEQSIGIRQINAAVSRLEKVTLENAAAAEETSASSNALKEETDGLKKMTAEAAKMIRKV